MHPRLNLPSFEVRLRVFEGQNQIYDPMRKKYVALTPEEWVRQHFVHYLVAHKGFPAGLMAIEMPVDVNGMTQRADIVAHNTQGKPLLIVECKAYNVTVGNQTYAQAARYNLALQAGYLVVTNGMQHYCSRVDLQSRQFTHLSDIPDFSSIG